MKKILTVLFIFLLPLAAAAQQNWKTAMRYDKQDAKAKLTERLSQYVTFDTQSDPSVKQVPSTKGQLVFAKALAKELKRLGASNVKTGKTGIVTADIPATAAKPAPVIALLAHMDTAKSASGKNVKPQVHAKYKGGDIVINREKDLRLTEYNSPQLLRAHGHDIVTASGDTLLGADDKAGVAVIMTLAEYLLANPAIEHGLVKIVFTPDEEINTGIYTLDAPSLGADYAYTADGLDLGEIIVENFGERTFTAVFEGNRAVHLGYAMNSDFADNLLMASDFHTLLPRQKRPETTSGMNGFIQVGSITTQKNRTEVRGVIYAFSDEEMQTLSDTVTQAFNTTKAIHSKNTGTELTFQDNFKNAKSLLPEPLISVLEAAMRLEDIQPKRIAARGGTDAAILSFKGLPTVDIFAGMFNMHSLLEYADVDVMEASLRTLLQTVSLWSLQEKPAQN